MTPVDEPVTETQSRTWTLTISAPCAWLTANDTRHWSAQGALVRQWRNAVHTAAIIAKLPHGLDRIRVDVVARFRGRAPVRDTDNLRPTVKAAIDGLAQPRTFRRNGRTHHSVGYGLIADDDVKHLEGPYLTIGDPLPVGKYAPTGELILTISEVAP